MDAPVALFTGTLTGAGAATALAFARNGYAIVVSGPDEATGLALAQSIRDLSGEALFIKADIGVDRDVGALVARAIQRFGKIDVAINTAEADPLRGGAPAIALMFDAPDRHAPALVFHLLRAHFARNARHYRRERQSRTAGAAVFA